MTSVVKTFVLDDPACAQLTIPVDIQEYLKPFIFHLFV